MGVPTDKSAFARPMTLTLTAAVVVVAQLLPLIPEPYRAFNVALFGALGLFVAARVGFWPAVLVTLGSKAAADVVGYFAHNQDANYLPIWYVLAAFLAYPLCGRLLRRTENPFAVGGAAVAGSVLFFAVTNFASWVRQDLPYGYTLGGLAESYRMGVPFYRGTFLGDLFGAVGLFAAHAVLSRVLFPAERVAAATATVSTNERS